MDRNLDQSFKVKQGTSYAAPQVAALATYLWMISPQLRDGPLADTISAITGNATGADDQIDAYGSVLSLDPVGEPDPATWRVRVALLDVDDSGSFDENDVTAFRAAYEAPDAGQSPDYSRHDLNGDGFTGGEHGLNRFDLDRTGSVRYGAPALSTVYVSIYGAGRDIDERSPSDKDILCYYAYSALYTGDTEARDGELRDWCAGITVDVTPAETSVAPGGTVNFAADVSGAADPGVTWVLPGGGGSISEGGVFTAGNSGGSFTVRAISVEDPNAFGDATVVIQGEGGGPPGSYAGTVTQGVDTSSSSTATNPDDGWTRVTTDVASEVVTWRILAEDGNLSNATGTIDYLYESTHTDNGSSGGPPCNYTITTAGQIPISGMNSSVPPWLAHSAR
jgi:hypothetical protein